MQSTDGHEAPAPEPMSCRVCLENKIELDLLRLRCGCLYCDSCLTTFVTRSLDSGSSFPPRCHGRAISPDRAMEYLPEALLRSYRAKTHELSARDKTYCSKVECNAFVTPQSIHNGQASCQKCNTVTCVQCKENRHFGPCATGGVVALRALARKHKWQECPDCKRLIDRIDGCRHMSCHCGSEFCYVCGVQIDNCNCDLENSDVDDDPVEDDDPDDNPEDRVPHDPRHYQPYFRQQLRERTPVFKDLEENIIEDTLVAPFEMAKGEE